MFRRIIAIAALAVTALIASTGAKAAEPPPTTPAYDAYASAYGHNWSGAFVGIEAGTSANGKTSSHSDFSFSGFSGVTDNNATIDGSAMFGVNLGYLRQMNMVVVGIEAGLYKTHLASSVDITNCSGCGYSDILQTKIDWMATTELIFGVAYRDLLLYGFGGIAAAPMEVCDQFTLTSYSSRTCNKYGSLGGTWGLGIMYALPMNLSLDVRYRNTKFTALRNTNESSDGYVSHQNVDATVSALTGTLRYHF